MSDFSDSEISNKLDDKDDDFNISDYHDELDSDDSYSPMPDTKDVENESDNKCEQSETQGENEYIGPVLPGGHRFDRKFTCILYPGNVVNADKAIETLGGLSAISTAVDTPNRRLELRFRPDDVYCKPACGDRHSTTGFLLRVRVKKSRVQKAQEAEVNKDDKHTLNISGNNSTDKDGKPQSDCSKNVNQENQIISDLADRVENCSVGTMDDLKDSPRKNSASASAKELHDLCMESDLRAPLIEKDIPPTFERNKYEDLSQDKDYEIPKMKVLGRVDTEYRFQNLCDFQYLPITQNLTDPAKVECLYDQIYPSNLPHYSWLKNKVPYFLPPAAFSRMGTVQQYTPKTEHELHPVNVIGKTRKRRAGLSNFIYFSTPDVPTKPPSGIETAMKVKFVQNSHLDIMRKIFEERPIWSKNAIMYKTKFTTERLKILLPSVAYYFVSGPWKIMWVKLGYDPRKDITARKYQTLDYRLKAMRLKNPTYSRDLKIEFNCITLLCQSIIKPITRADGLGSTVKCKRNYSEYTLPYKSGPVSKPKAPVLSASLSTEQSQKKEAYFNEDVYIYREGTVPPSRQMFYQYCDVHVDEIQEMLAKLPDPLPGAKCHEKNGWLPNGFDAQCREIINKQVRIVLRKRMNIPEDQPASLPRKRKLAYKIKLQKIRKKTRRKVSNTNADDPKPGTSKTAD